MARVKVPSGTIQKFEEVFDDLQTNIKSNVKKQFETLLNDQFGNVITRNNGTTPGTAFSISRSDTTQNPRNFVCQAGAALTRSGDTIVLNAPATADVAYSTPNAYFLIKLRYMEVGGSAITAMNSFLYDSTGTSAYSTKYTRFVDSYQFSYSQILEASG